MRFYTGLHRFYCGVDLHARTLSLHVLDAQGKTALATTIPAGPDAFLGAVAPFRDGLAVAGECMFAWSWLASGWGGRPLDKCLVQLHADATIRKSRAARSEAVNSSPVITPR